ncbi:MAG TPA: pyruvate kinase, partial [Campylobacterales bacterium]|nr:pyruvate kinase [Campylobacterales bacterium]
LRHEALVPFTTSGLSAQTLSKYRPEQSIYAISHSLKTHRRLNLVWGIRPLFIMKPVQNPTKLLYNFVKKVLDEKRITEDKRFIVTIGSTTGKAGSSNLIRLLNKEGMEAVLASEF